MDLLRWASRLRRLPSSLLLAAAAGCGPSGGNVGLQVKPERPECSIESSDCPTACANYDLMMDELAKNPRLVGDRLTRPACLRLCSSPDTREEAISWACHARFAKADKHTACVKECR